MKAIVVTPGVAGSLRMESVPDPEMRAGEVAVRVRRVGLCGTDAEIVHGLYGQPPAGDDVLVLGHENLGVVEDVGRRVRGLRPGDLVVATVRRPCGVCRNCRGGEPDMCSSGAYTERGIMRQHGFMAEYYVEAPAFLNRIPRALSDVAVLLEPLSIVEKGIEQVYAIQRRMIWKPALAIVLGAGPVGLLACAALRARGVQTIVAAREAGSDPRARIARDLGAEYIPVGDTPLADLPRRTGHPDLVVEATGSARVAFDAIEMLALNGVLCLLSVTGGSSTSQEPIDRLNQLLVLGNRAIVGSVNANARHFELGIKDMARIEKRFPGVLARMITGRVPWTEYPQRSAGTRDGIKTTLEL